MNEYTLAYQIEDRHGGIRKIKAENGWKAFKILKTVLCKEYSVDEMSIKIQNISKTITGSIDELSKREKKNGRNKP